MNVFSCFAKVIKYLSLGEKEKELCLVFTPIPVFCLILQCLKVKPKIQQMLYSCVSEQENEEKFLLNLKI